MKKILATICFFTALAVNAQDVLKKICVDDQCVEIQVSGQTLSLGGVGNKDLSISDGNTVTLPIPDDTDQQTITDFSLSGNILSITLERGNTITVDLSPIAGGGSSVDEAANYTWTGENKFYSGNEFAVGVSDGDKRFRVDIANSRVMVTTGVFHIGQGTSPISGFRGSLYASSNSLGGWGIRQGASNVNPFLAMGTNGTVDDRFVFKADGTLQLAQLPNASLATDANGNIIASSGGFEKVDLVEGGTFASGNQFLNGKPVLNYARTGTITQTLDNARVGENDEFYAANVKAGATLEISEGTATMENKDKGSNDAVRVNEYGSINLIEDVDGNFDVTCDECEWFSNVVNLYADNDAPQPTPNETDAVGASWFFGSGDQLDALTSEESPGAPDNGTSYLRAFEASGGGTSARARYSPTYLNSGTYTITLRVNPITGASPTVTVYDANTAANQLVTQALTAGGGWQTVSLTFTATTDDWSIMFFPDLGDNAVDGEMLIDNITITQ